MKIRVHEISKIWLSSLMVVAIFFVDAVFRSRSYDDKSFDAQVALKLLVYAAVFLVGLYLQRKNSSNYYYPHNKAVFLLIISFAASSAWSPNMAYSLVASFSLLAFFLFITSYASAFGTDDLLECMALSILAFMLVSFFFYFFIPSVGKISYWEFDVFVEGGRMSGIAGSANNLGRVACLGVIVAVHLSATRQSRLFKVLFLLSFLALLLSMNRSSILMALLGIFIVTFSRRYEQVYALALFVGVACFSTLLFFVDDFLYLISRSGNIDEILTFTGRTYIWTVVLELLLHRPFLGYGYGSSMFVLPLYESAIGFTASHAHNMLLQVLLYLGFWGGVIMTLSFVLYFACQKNITKIQIALITFVVYNGLLESGAFNGLVNITTVALFVAFSTNQKRELD